MRKYDMESCNIDRLQRELSRSMDTDDQDVCEEEKEESRDYGQDDTENPDDDTSDRYQDT